MVQSYNQIPCQDEYTNSGFFSGNIFLDNNLFVGKNQETAFSFWEISGVGNLTVTNNEFRDVYWSETTDKSFYFEAVNSNCAQNQYRKVNISGNMFINTKFQTVQNLRFSLSFTYQSNVFYKIFIIGNTYDNILLNDRALIRVETSSLKNIEILSERNSFRRLKALSAVSQIFSYEAETVISNNMNISNSSILSLLKVKSVSLHIQQV